MFNSCQVEVFYKVGDPIFCVMKWKKKQKTYIYFCCSFSALYVRKATFQKKEEMPKFRAIERCSITKRKKKTPNKQDTWKETILVTLAGNNLQSNWQRRWESVGKGHYYKLFPAGNLEYTEDTKSFAMKIRITSVVNNREMSNWINMCFGKEEFCRGENKEKEPQHSCLSLVPQHVWPGADTEVWTSHFPLHFPN